MTTYRDRKLLIYLNTKCDEIIEQLEKKAKFERQKAHAATLQGAKLIEYIKERIFDIDKGEPPKDIQSIFLFQSSNPEYNYWTKWSKETLQVVQPQLKTNLTDPQRELLFDELIKGWFIANDTDRDSFLWAFGGSVPPVNYKPIKWLKPKHTLAEMIKLINGKLSNENKKNAGIIFFNNGKPLTNPKKDECKEISSMQAMVKKIRPPQ